MPRPLGPFHDIASSAAPGVRARQHGDANRSALFDLVLDELSRPPTSTLLLIDDIHWADQATLDLVKFLGRRIQRVPARCR